MSATRTKMVPDVPTFKAQGIDINLALLRGLAAPSGLPPTVRDILVKALQRAITALEFQSKAAQAYAPARYLAPARYETELRSAEVGFRKLWKEMPWTDK